MGERIRRGKVRKLMGWVKDSLAHKANAMYTRKAKQRINSLLPIGRQGVCHLQESRAPRWITVTWEDKCHHSEHPPLPFYSPSFTCWAWCHMVWDIPLVSWGQLSQLYFLPYSCAPPAYSLVSWYEKQKRPWLCGSTAQQYRKHPCVINIVFSTNPEHSLLLAAMNKTNSILAKTSTFSTHFSYHLRHAQVPHYPVHILLITILLPILWYNTQISFP